MSNVMKFKALIKKVAKEKQITAQSILQNFMLERFLERMSLSSYKDKFILKGGFLIASIAGLSARSTMDMDATIKGYPVTQKSIESMISEIIDIQLNDEVAFVLSSIKEIRETDDYAGYRAALKGEYANSKLAVDLKIDITTGDSISPKEIKYSYPLLFENRSISILAYSFVTVLAEKIETILFRGDQSTRPRDYYDVFLLLKLFEERIDFSVLFEAIHKTATRRNSVFIFSDYPNILDSVKHSKEMQKRWEIYQYEYSYAQHIIFDDICDLIKTIMDKEKVL